MHVVNTCTAQSYTMNNVCIKYNYTACIDIMNIVLSMVFLTLIYRDLKVENMMLDNNKNIKLIGKHRQFVGPSSQPKYGSSLNENTSEFQ